MKKLLLIPVFLGCLAAKAQVSTDSLSNDVRELKKGAAVLAWLKKFHISGYAQFQYQHTDTDNVKTFEGGNFAANSNNRFKIRRGRLKVEFSNENKKGVINYYAVVQINVNENGINMTDYWAKVVDPWTNTVAVSGGMMNLPFGYEIGYSSRYRETPERGRMSQILFPQERDLGFMLTIEPPAYSKFNFFKINAGVYNGTGLGFAEIDRHKDFAGQLILRHDFLNKHLRLSGGASYYNGAVMQSTPAYYSFVKDTGEFFHYRKNIDSSAIGKKYFKREYIGFDAQLTGDYKWGSTTLRAEYIFGTQPGMATANNTPTATGFDIYNRSVNGAYFYFVQTFKDVKHNMSHELVFKYDWFDPNTHVAGKQISSAAAYFTPMDIKYQTFGVGYNFKPNEWVKLMCYYAIVKNESTGLAGYTGDLKDNVLTIRTQIMFK